MANYNACSANHFERIEKNDLFGDGREVRYNSTIIYTTQINHFLEVF